VGGLGTRHRKSAPARLYHHQSSRTRRRAELRLGVPACLLRGTPYLTRAGKLPNIANPEMKSDAQRKQIDLIQ